jgi:hypothetical protein
MQNTVKAGLKDVFENKIYIAVQYDLSDVQAETDTEEIQQIHMQILVSFPKDK